ncbi:primosomal protein N' [Pirellula staleyi DSM 6068]|uniref:Replication restart protein PriA n=1 Tax=Pirellula staleyi (strain ATCC 27377 / DSM 6068 / ICPB 4128) TaxID=530564 RepID=D2R7W4_PIRSD|nr:primosomal protein N' [Pirellula staleyi DSM 6068]
MTPSQASLFDRTPDAWDLDAAQVQLVAEVVFRDPPFGPFDYLIPEPLAPRLKPGARVQVPLGASREVVGYCTSVTSKPASGRPLKAIAAVIDDVPLVERKMLELTRWMSDYYLCPWGQVLHGVVPAGVRGNAGTRETTFLSLSAEGRQILASGVDRSGEKPKKVLPAHLEILRILGTSPRELTPVELGEFASCSIAQITGLRKKKWIASDVRRVRSSSHEELPLARTEPLALHPAQSHALAAINRAIDRRTSATILLHGVTGSGKTEVYIQAIERVISFGQQAIVLVPEISLTPQTRQRFRSRFDRVAVLHSHLSDAERHYHWEQIARGEVQVIVGARSAVFAPAPHLGLIVIDEEHDGSFKQSEAPRYHARDVAEHRALQLGIPLVLGTATPSLESYYRARSGKYELVPMPDRVEGRELPHVGTIDLRVEFQSRSSRGSIGRQLHTAIAQAIAEKGQVILLLNRRGYSTHVQCPACGFVAKCEHCDLALTHHREEQLLVCHHCDFTTKPPERCPDCTFDGIRYSGLGTEKLEAEIKARFPAAKVLRMDSDTMQKPGSHEAALAKFRSGEVQILLGTQMIAKGLDFPNVTLVGVINADTALHLPDFRAAERTFQLVTQVAGRTGRGELGGRVLVQTFSPDHPAIEAAVDHDYAKFVGRELPDRVAHGFPPFTTLLRLIVRGDSESKTREFATMAAESWKKLLEAKQCEHRILGPAPCAVARLRGKFRFHALATSVDSDTLRATFREASSTWKTPDDVQWVIDVDAIDLL